MTQFHCFQLQVTGLSWNSTGSVVAASYPCSTLQVYLIFGSSSADVSLIWLTATNQWFRIQHIKSLDLVRIYILQTITWLTIIFIWPMIQDHIVNWNKDISKATKLISWIFSWHSDHSTTNITQMQRTLFNYHNQSRAQANSSKTKSGWVAPQLNH